LRSASCEVHQVNWISHVASDEPMRAAVKIRHKHVPAEATVIPVGRDAARVMFDTPQRAITSGQGAVFYDGERVLGGGWIR
jgi:tRNA-uridine 2-sulfurtransferase